MDQITSAIGVLGVYVALMAVLSVGVEAILDWLKIRWFQAKAAPSDVLKDVKSWLPEEEGEAWKAKVEALNKSLKSLELAQITLPPKGTKPGDIAFDVAKMIGQATTKYAATERARLGWIRALAVLFGILLAYAFQIDTLELLAPLSISASKLWLGTLGPQGTHALGIVLSGVAASAGSGFWHDQSARLRSMKEASESVKTAVGKAG